MVEYEKLGSFYLGRPYDLTARAPGEGVVLYDSRDLVTHAVIVGMTGSGKTGLGIDLLEEAAMDGIPAIAIDPKGDLGNLLLTFPRLAPEDFRPWIDEDEAARKGMTPEEYAADQAATWKKGLAAWGQDPSRIERLRQTTDLAIYTPGSSAGLGLSILRSFAMPPPQVLDDPELLAERLSTLVSGLLTLVHVDADPVRSREHILLSTVVDVAWKAGESLDLGGLIGRIQNPQIDRIGVLDLESFYPAKERFELAMKLNGLLAAPGFAAWLEGDPLNIDHLLHTDMGKPRISVVSIAHLGDSERIFFVALLLNELLGWMRKQAGTTSLRAVLYIDEVAGYMPPVANPASKPPLLTLLKQARAFGLGVVVATQNPIDIDYKALSNAGTWFLGRLQTEQDKERLLDGLEGALARAPGFDRGGINKTLSALGKRIFLLHDVHEDGPQIFETRWAMSYLRGPLTREHIRALTASAKAQARAAGSTGVGGEVATRTAAQNRAVAGTPGRATTASPGRPVLPPEVPQYFLPLKGMAAGDVRYEPRVWAAGQVEYSDPKSDLRDRRTVKLLAPLTGGVLGIDWDRAEATMVELAEIEEEPSAGATFEQPPPDAANPKNYATWSKDFARWLYETQTLDLFRYAKLDLTSRPAETEREFRIRLQQALREERDAAKEKLQRKYAPKVAALQDRLRRAEVSVEREQEQASNQSMQSVFSMGATVLGALLGRKVISATNVGKAATAARSVGRARKESRDVARAEENREDLEQKLSALRAELEAEIGLLDAGVDPLTVNLETLSVKPKKTQISVGQVGLAWVPRDA